MFTYFKQIWNSKDLRNKILFTIGILVIYRFIAQITVPGANTDALAAIAAQSNNALDFYSVFTGGSAENLSIVLMGIGPYINASIIIQLLGVISPKVESLQKEGESGRRKINSYTRWLTLPLAFLQSYGMLFYLNSLTAGTANPDGTTSGGLPLISDITDPSVILPIMLTITAGTILLMWLGEQISEKGIGNGISLIIFGSIISQIPPSIGQSLFLASGNDAEIMPLVVAVLVSIILMVVVVIVNEAARRVPITYAGRGVRGKGDQAFLPIRINQAGMIPIIFAVALVSLPSLIGQFMANAQTAWVRNIGDFLSGVWTINSGPYIIAYFLFVVAFTYFYVSITFNPEQVAENIQKRGGYVPGIRPGQQTTDHLKEISSRLTLFGSLFLGTIAVLPIILQFALNSSAASSITIALSGAGIIIIVGVVLELIRQINAQLIMHDYKKFT